MLRVKNLCKSLGDFALRDVSFDVEEGEYFVVLGASGMGKTVLLEMLVGITPPDAGQVFWNGEDITNARIQRRRFGLVCQNQSLFPHISVYGNIAYGLRARRLPRRDVDDKTRAYAEEVGVTALLDRMPGTLSGGEAQRVALARALATEPRCLLLDEPIASLDIQARGQMRALLRNLHRRGRTVIHVTHDYEEAISLASRVGIMEQGSVVEVGTPREVFQHPKSEFVARFVGIRNVYKGRLLPANPGGGDARRFVAGELAFTVLTDAAPGPGCLIVRSEDITVSLGKSDTSAQNSFRGKVMDVVPARLGVEIAIDIGVEVAAWVTAESVDRLGIQQGKEVWISFKASAARFIED
jgi:molybdopterin-binding protein